LNHVEGVIGAVEEEGPLAGAGGVYQGLAEANGYSDLGGTSAVQKVVPEAEPITIVGAVTRAVAEAFSLLKICSLFVCYKNNSEFF